MNVAIKIFPLGLFTILSCSNSETEGTSTINNTTSSILENDLEERSVPDQQYNLNALHIEFLIENSGSMFGYVSTPGDYFTVVSTLAADCELFCNSINYCFLNAKQTQIGSSLERMTSRLNLNGMRVGDPSTSDLNSMFQTALDKSGNQCISILISDGIYSVSGTGDVLSQLQSESLVTRNRFIQRLEDEDLSTYLIKYTSDFNGVYYTHDHQRIQIDQLRPYYVWIIGPNSLLQEHFTDEYLKSLPGFTSIVKFVKLKGGEIKSKYVMHNELGKIRYNPYHPFELSKVRPGRGGVTRFSIAFDFSQIPYSDDYFLNDEIYENNNGFKIDNVGTTSILGAAAAAVLPSDDYSHVVTFSTDKSPLGRMIIQVKDDLPEWIEETNDSDDIDIMGDTIHTFGFRYLIDGIAKAYDHINQSENLYEVTYILKYN